MPFARPRLAAISIVVVRALSMIFLPVLAIIDGVEKGRFTKAGSGRWVSGVGFQML